MALFRAKREGSQGAVPPLNKGSFSSRNIGHLPQFRGVFATAVPDHLSERRRHRWLIRLVRVARRGGCAPSARRRAPAAGVTAMLLRSETALEVHREEEGAENITGAK